MSEDTQPERAGAAPPPAVILVRPQLGVNIGTATRAMMNTGLADLRLVAPREGWPNPHAAPAASGAAALLETARVYDDVTTAVAGLQRVYATTWRPRWMVKRVLTPRAAAAEIRQLGAEGAHCGILFGPERTGLENEDLAFADALITVPLNPEFASLNLAQAVLLVGYEWWLAADRTAPDRLLLGDSPLADRAAFTNFLTRLMGHLEEVGFFHPPEKRPHMERNLEAVFARMTPTEQELRTLFGMIKALRFGGPRGFRGGEEES